MSSPNQSKKEKYMLLYTSFVAKLKAAMATSLTSEGYGGEFNSGALEKVRQLQIKAKKSKTLSERGSNP